MSFDTIIYKTRGPLDLITLKRPDKLNAINEQMVHDQNAALDYGLRNRVVATDHLKAEAEQLGMKIAGNDSVAVRLTKRAINHGYDIAGMGMNNES